MARDRVDLGALLHRLESAVAEREVPLLRAHHIEMWDYMVLAGLQHGPVTTQSQLAVAVGRDKTRLIQNLDRLENLGLLHRKPDPEDRRNRIITLTVAGRTVLEACRADIRTMEADLLANLPESSRASFIRDLTTLAKSATDAKNG
jgi:DNA-binding MarR family transcriptional regulator